jgi:putative transposase
VTDDSKTKLELLNREYGSFQAYLQGNQSVDLYSATRQQADRLKAKILKHGGRLNPKKQCPLILRRDLIDVQKDSKFPCVYWMRVPVYPKSINLRIQTDCRYELIEYNLREAKVMRRKGDWYIYACIEKKETEEEPKAASNVLAIDLGVRHIAVSVNTANTRPNFYGQKLRQIRGKYFNLRRKLGQKKAFYKIKELKNREFLQVNHELHKISKAIVEEARRTNAVIVVGKLKGIRRRIKGSRRIRRLINNFPYYRLVQYIKYKAEWLGINVMEISEAFSSQTCHRCGQRSKSARRTQGWYVCDRCRLDTNADYNGSMNIMQRALSRLSKVGGHLTEPEPLVIVGRSKVITGESHMPQRWE